MSNPTNPFNITTAVDYSDSEINKYWVDFMSDSGGLSNLLKTDSPMPMIILGGKGSGKTHIMRYYSYNAKRIKYEDKIIKGINYDKYLGVYMRCGGLNASRFDSPGEKNNKTIWKNIFAYYVELWFSQVLIKIIEDILRTKEPTSEIKEIENIICSEISNKAFDQPGGNSVSTFKELASFIQDLQKEVDYKINNYLLTGEKSPDIQILISPGRLIFGLPQILQNKLVFLRDIKFIYLIDEYENLLEYQQQYINTLLREREAPVTFRVGARRYGMKTYKTFSGNEYIKEGSEYEKHVIDKEFRDNENQYRKFSIDILRKRLVEADFFDTDQLSVKNNLSIFFEEFNYERFFKTVKAKGELIGHFKSLKSKLKHRLKEDVIKKIIANLTNQDIIIERTNIFLFYREWRQTKGSHLLQSSEIIKSEAIKYVEGKEATRHETVLDKFKKDIIDQIFREAQERIPYTGLENLIVMSAGIPRLLLITLKHIFRWSQFLGEKPFKGTKIGVEAQALGIEDAINWFLEDARVPGVQGRAVADSIKRLGQFLQEVRFSDIPPECSLCAFSIDTNEVKDENLDILENLEQYSYIIKVGERRDKNSDRKDIMYQVNGLLCPRWELPISRRGILQLNPDEVNQIFAVTKASFEPIKANRVVKYNAPFQYIDSNTPLFDAN